MRTSIALAALLACGSPSSQEPPPTSAAALLDVVLATSGHVIVLKSSAQFPEHRDVATTARGVTGVTSAEPFLLVELSAVGPSRAKVDDIVGKGLAADSVMRSVTAPAMQQGSFALAATPPTIVIGDALARSLGARVGDSITLTRKPVPGAGPSTFTPVVARVGGIFHLGFDEYDRKLVFLALASLQVDAGEVMGIEIRVTDRERAAAIATELEKQLGGPPYQVSGWKTFNPTLADEVAR